jgi:hypothetical protein
MKPEAPMLNADNDFLLNVRQLIERRSAKQVPRAAHRVGRFGDLVRRPDARLGAKIDFLMQSSVLVFEQPPGLRRLALRLADGAATHGAEGALARQALRKRGLRALDPGNGGLGVGDPDQGLGIALGNAGLQLAQRINN